MILTKSKHFKQMVKPYNKMQQQPASYDLRLDFRVRREGEEETTLSDNPYIEPGEFMLASTVEYVRIPEGVCGHIVGKSSNARMGLSVENAGFVDPGFHGTITLELKNFSSKPIDLRDMFLIAQLKLETTELGGELYNGHYQGQVGATPSWKERKLKKQNGKEL